MSGYIYLLPQTSANATIILNLTIGGIAFTNRSISLSGLTLTANNTYCTNVSFTTTEGYIIGGALWANGNLYKSNNQYLFYSSTENIVSKLHLGKNDYTDGVIVFTAPEGFTCHKYENEGITSHILEKGDSIHITITGGYDTQNTNSNFEYYWNNWKDSEMNNHTNVILENSKYTIHDNYCHFRSIRYEADTPIVWSFALLFNEYSGKVCVCSIWSFEGMSNNINDIIAVPLKSKIVL